ncbi:MAG: 6-phospho-beta-glucosidase [Dermatophilaceae bacterium]
MKLAILGGGGFRVPLVYRAVRDDPEHRIGDVVLHDVDAGRLAGIGRILRGMAIPGSPRVTTTTSLTGAISGADVVFVAIRVGGLSGRVADERVALGLGLLGQETTGAGGLAFGLRTVPVADDLARRIRAEAPAAWVVNFTNPAGMITEAMQRTLGDRVIGICDSPVALGRRAARALGLGLEEVGLGYAGLNHLGWLRSLTVNGVDRLPDLLADDAALSGIEEGRLFGADRLRALGGLPNEYLHYYYDTASAIAENGRGPTRGEFLATQQARFFRDLPDDPGAALTTWEATLAERNATYMAASRGDAPRAEDDLVSGGYEGVALALMHALTGGTPRRLILDVRAPGAIPGLPDDAVVELSCRVDRTGVHPLPAVALPDAERDLVHTIKRVEGLVIDAALQGNPALAEAGFARHPLVGPANARALLAAYRAGIPEVDAVFH